MATLKAPINPADFSILVVDDEESIRALLADALNGWGFKVATAPNGEVAYEYLKKGELPHIVLTDIRMGGMTGVELTRKVKEISNEIEVIIMTSHGSLDTAVEAMRIGVYDYLSKPFGNIEYVHTVVLHVCERIYMRLYTEYLLQEVQRQNHEVQALANYSRNLATSLDPQTTMKVGCEGLSAAFQGLPVVFFALSADFSTLAAGARFPENLFGGTVPAVAVSKVALEKRDSLSIWLSKLGQAEPFINLLKQAASLSPDLFIAPQHSDWTVRSLVIRGVPLGAVALAKKIEKGSEDEDLLNRYLETLGVNYDNAVLHARTLESSIRDGLTGLFNVRHFRERLAQELSLAQRFEQPLSLMFFDVDHFKKYNDQHGHQAGDALLKKVATLLRASFRNTEIIARYGGEEFVVLMHKCNLANALAKAERLRQIIETTNFEGGSTQPLGKVTVSIGVAEYPLTAGNAEGLIKAADEAMYEAKHKSRNLVLAAKAVEGHIPSFKALPSASPAGVKS